MKKLISFIIGFVFFGTALFCNMVVKNNNCIEGLNLKNLVHISVANAENNVSVCYTYYGNTGVCCFFGGSGCNTQWGQLDGPYYNY